jgi:hypothetical protein
MRGETHHAAKLTNDDAAYIRLVYKPKDREFGAVALAKRFGVHRTSIENIVAGRTFC